MIDLSGRYDQLQTFLSEELNTTPLMAAFHSCVLGFAAGLSSYRVFTGEPLGLVAIGLGIAAVAYVAYQLFSGYREWMDALGDLDERARPVFVWAALPSFPVGAAGIALAAYVSNLLGTGPVGHVLVLGFGALVTLAFCGWLGSMTARHILDGGMIPWAGMK